MLDKMQETQKITTNIPKELLAKAREVTHGGITETIKIALEQITKAKAYEDLLRLKGKANFSLNLNELREDKIYDRR